MRRIKFSFISVFVYAASCAATGSAQTIDPKVYLGLLPKDYTVNAATTGDLDRDGIDELVLVGVQPVTTDHSRLQKQVLFIFKGKSNGEFTQWKTGAEHFLDSSPDLIEKGGIVKLGIKKGVLEISSSTATASGGMELQTCTQKWRQEKTGLRLIGLKTGNLNRSCACGSNTDWNLLTGRKVIKTDRSSSGEAMENETTSETRETPTTVLWENFRFKSYCSP